jgi:DNA helicase IV
VSLSDNESEQRYVDRLYARLDYLHDRTEADLARVRRAGATGTPQARSERDAFATLYEARLVQLRGVEDKLCFGRLDVRDRSIRYIGRIGMFDDEQVQLLVDWRAPAAREFYQATAANPGEVLLRRHLETRGRVVTGVYDDVLDAEVREDAGAADTADEGALAADGVLLAALNASRTGRMTDIVATIQSEQDEIIRAPLNGTVVVQGGPGTGKTAVALHRAAYLLYTHRDRLASRGVLLVGPSSVFLRYISQVLPSLGETGVVTTTPEELFPGITVTAVEGSAAAVLKGEPGMATVIDNAVRQRQRVPNETRVLKVEGVTIRLRPRAVSSSIETARRTGKPHNTARVTFVRSMLDHMADLVARATGSSLDSTDKADIIESLRDSRDVRRELNVAWPPLSPRQLLEDLFASPEQVHGATPGMSNDERVLLLRSRGSGWTLADVPLLDEAAELLGFDDSAERADAERAALAQADEVKYAQEVLSGVGGSASHMLSAQELASRFADHDLRRNVSDSAAEDRSWAYGHIIVDEAQELSSMMWRLLMRRCPSGSMTIVGDIAQTGTDAGAPSWEKMLSPLFGDQWQRYELSVNYRTPKQIMDVASQMLIAAGVDAPMPRSVRSSNSLPRSKRIATADDFAIVDCARQERDRVGSGRVAVIVPERLWVQIGHAITEALHTDRTDIDAQVAVLTAVGAKGLEFDVVVVVEPQEILDESTRGANHLYVALSRATQRLIVLHSADLPGGMRAALSVATD